MMKALAWISYSTMAALVIAAAAIGGTVAGAMLVSALALVIPTCAAFQKGYPARRRETEWHEPKIRTTHRDTPPPPPRR